MLLGAVAVLAFVVGFAALLLRRPSTLVPLTMVAMWAATPRFVPSAIALPGGLGLLPYEPLLVATALYLGSRSRPSPRAVRGILVLSGVIVWGVLSGILAGASPARIANDARGLVTVALVAWCAACISGSDLQQRAGRTLVRILWWSAGLTLAAAAGGLELAGRQERATQVFTRGAWTAGDATRYVTNATHLSLAVACGIAGLAAAGRVSLWSSRKALVPVGVILALSFSRNTVLGIAAAALFGFLPLASFRHLTRATVQALAVVGAVVALVVLSPRLADVPGVGFAARQVDTYTERVFAGLGGEARARDASVTYREDETADLTAAASSALVAGHGFGHKYRRVGGPVTEDLAYYGHDFYLWLVVKAGVVGLAGFAWFAAPITTRSRRRGPRALGLGATGVGLLVVSVVAPLPNGFQGGGAASVGAVVGLLAAPARARRPAAPVSLR